MKKYMISFNIAKGNEKGFGNAFLTIEENYDIFTEEHIVEIQNKFKNDYKYDVCCLQNIIELN